jgi:type VI secretion system protein ImpD
MTESGRDPRIATVDRAPGPSAPAAAVRRDVCLRQLARAIARLDETISRQVDAILHHPRFQRLEAAWRGLALLLEEAEPGAAVKVKVLTVTWKELSRDAQRAVEFDQSQLFRRIYSEEFDMPGGEPFGVLIGDFEIRHRPSAEHPIDDLEVLTSISQTAAAAFCPFIAGADPALFGLRTFSQFERSHHVEAIFEQAEYLRWRRIRQSEDARFVGLTLPRILMRLPYDDDGSRHDGFRYREDVAGPDFRKYLWGNAAFAFGRILIRCFNQSGWLAEIRGVNRNEEGRGLVTGIPAHAFGLDATGVALKSSTDLMINDRLERDLSDAGFIPLSHCKDTEYSAFYGNQSLQKPKEYNKVEATMNAKISAMLQYVLCASRFAHYLKAIERRKVGSFSGKDDLSDELSDWIASYVSADTQASPETRAAYPLRDARITLEEFPERPGVYFCTMHLRPHCQLDDVMASVVLRTEFAPRQTE